MNLEPSASSFQFHDSRMGRSGDLVPDWVEEMLAGAAAR